MIYTITFNPAIDYIVHTPPLIEGTINRTTSEHFFFGGKGINVSSMLGRLGMRNIALGFVAGFTGAAIEQGLHKAGVATDFIHLSSGVSRINIKLKSNLETDINGRGPDIGSAQLAALFSQLDLLSAGDTVVLAGSIPASMPDDTYEQILARLNGHHIQFIVDAAGNLLRNVLKYKPFLVKPNHLELEELTDMNFDFVSQTAALSASNLQTVASAARSLQAQGARNVLVSMAAKGVFLMTEDGMALYLAAPSGKAVNSAGAGDSMVAGFLYGYGPAADYSKALQFAVAAGSASAFSEDLASRDAVLQLSAELAAIQTL